MVDRQVDGEEIVEHKGTKIELCCSACVKKFKKDPDYYVAYKRTPATDSGETCFRGFEAYGSKILPCLQR